MNLWKYIEKNTFFISLGTIFAVTGIVMSILCPKIFDHIINNELTMSPTSKTFEIWKKPPIPLHIDFYFFNWTNPEDIRNHSIKPRFQQVGPYRFKEIKEKTDIQWNANGTVTFRQMRKWFYDDSSKPLDDEVVTLNVISLTAVFQARNWNYLLQKGISLSLSTINKDIYIRRTVRELLFEGYDDPLIDMARTMPSFSGMTVPPWDKFGWFYQRNGSSDFDGVFNMETGSNNIKELGVLKNWNNNSRTNFYEGYCGMVNGSAGEFWPPGRTKDSISLFSPDLCRSITFDYDEEVQIKDITGYKFSGGVSILDNGTVNPNNECFCTGECIPSGVMNVSRCRFGAPAFVSFPHFYQSDPIYANSVEGLTPSKEDHSFYIILEPTTGIPLDVAARLQINILLQPSRHIGLYSDVPKVFFPLLWFEQRAQINDELSAGLRRLLSLPIVGLTSSLTLMTFGLLLVVAMVMLRLRHYQDQKKKDLMINRWGNNKSQIIMNGQKPVIQSQEEEKLSPYKEDEI